MAQSERAPIGVFDSGFGGLTVLAELIGQMPGEDIIFVGDSARCPYGPRQLDEVRGFVLQICSWLVERGCKLIIIACNTATAAGLQAAQRAFPVPIIGVVEPGARAAVHATHSRAVGVIATRGTVASGAYERAIHHLDAGIEVVSLATPPFVELVEQGLQHRSGVEPAADVAELFPYAAYGSLVRETLAPLRKLPLDTLVLGCTHYPVIRHLIGEAMGPGVTLVSSAEEAARDAHQILHRREALADDAQVAVRSFFTTGGDVADFERFGSLVLGFPIGEVHHLDLPAYREDV
ncbi:glutamate racemase [Adlercreutzia murintestinalis]|uniref:glutamate racemase n=1 Tax=Adlercreutzia murintestinalis TaxID=2941325 RepID=UPI00203EB380|nr:glutamate racemase [Adlercreutzia murintestinalis]